MVLFFRAVSVPSGPGSGRWPKFVALAGNSCGSSRSGADSHSRAATTSAPTCRPPTYTGGGAAIMNYCTTLAFTFLCCALGVGQFVRFVGGFALFCCFVLGLGLGAFLFKIQAGSDQKQLKEQWEDVLSDSYCSFQRLENTFSVLSSEGWTH